MKNEGSVADTDKQKHANYQRFFFCVRRGQQHPTEFNPVCDDTLLEFTCNIRDVIKVIKRVKTKSSSGSDGLSGYFLRNTVAHIAGPLCKLFRRSLSERNIHDDWLSVFVVPLHNKSEVRCSGSCTPGSLTSTACKIFERIIRSQLLDYMLKNSSVLKSQHGFVSRKSTATNPVILLYSNWYDILLCNS